MTDSLIHYDWNGCILPGTGLAADALTNIASELNAARTEVLDVDVPLFRESGAIPEAKQPLDAGYIEMPERILAELAATGEASELGRILATAERLRTSVDKIVLLGIGGSYMGARAMMEACCHRYHNELSRADREGIPRLYFEGNNVDNDSAQALLDLLETGQATEIEDKWGIVVISKSGGTLETATSLRLFLQALMLNCGDDSQAIADRVVPVTGTSGKLFDLATAIGCPDIFEVPEGVGGRFSVLSAVGLLPAALLGLDVQRLLQGAADMTAHFRAAPVGSNAVLDFVGVSHLLEQEKMINVRVLSVWSNALESVGLWYDQLLAESLGKHEKGATPLTVVNTRDLHSRAQQHQEGARDKLMTNVFVEDSARANLVVPQSSDDQDKLNRIAGRTMQDILQAAFDGTNMAYRDDGRPTATIRMPRLDEYTLGQLFQMLMLATSVEGRLLQINPYGQPGVEAYKKHMMENLGLA